MIAPCTDKNMEVRSPSPRSHSSGETEARSEPAPHRPLSNDGKRPIPQRSASHLPAGGPSWYPPLAQTAVCPRSLFLPPVMTRFWPCFKRQSSDCLSLSSSKTLSLSAVSLLCLGLKDNNRVLSHLPKFGEIPKFLPLGLDSITLA